MSVPPRGGIDEAFDQLEVFSVEPSSQRVLLVHVHPRLVRVYKWISDRVESPSFEYTGFFQAKWDRREGGSSGSIGGSTDFRRQRSIYCDVLSSTYDAGSTGSTEI